MTDSLSAEMRAALQEAVSALEPIVIKAAQDAVTAALPPGVGAVAALAVTPVVDEIDALVAKLVGNTVPEVTAPTDPASQIASLQAHVAALTVATGHGTTSAMVTQKASANAPAPASGS
jgi:hypothetical protein